MGYNTVVLLALLWTVVLYFRHCTLNRRQVSEFTSVSHVYRTVQYQLWIRQHLIFIRFLFDKKRKKNSADAFTRVVRTALAGRKQCWWVWVLSRCSRQSNHMRGSIKMYKAAVVHCAIVFAFGNNISHWKAIRVQSNKFCVVDCRSA